MSERAVELARRFAQANDEVIAFVEGLTDEEWQAPCWREGRTVGQVVQHIGAGHRVIGGIVETMTLGAALPVAAHRTEAEGARYNARQAARFAHRSREDGVRLLRRNGATVQRRIAALTDEQLDLTTDTVAGPITTAQEIEHGLLGHMLRHFEAVGETVGR
jgi:uncharacterized damage-inducible protein DinB